MIQTEKVGGFLPKGKGEEADTDDEFEKPTMLFESYLSYDQLPEEKGRYGKIPQPRLPEKKRT